MSEESDNYEFSDEEIDNRKHDKIVEDVLNLNKIQNVKKPSRTEPTLNISEFDLVKSIAGDKGSVHVKALTKVLSNRKKHQEISRKVELTSTKSKTLSAPLEKPQADRIRRSVNYEKSRLSFDRWEALVTSNRAAPQLIFPLNSTEKLKIIEQRAEKYPSTWHIKSELQKELEKIDPKVEEYHINQEEDQFPLTLEELKERRSEAAKLRAHQSYKEAKARQQNKIKSKKYHRILKRERIKQKLKEFEELQKTDPEEALKKLEDIEKARAEERFSLRHKGTGQWAKSKQIRAKYDKESRQVLAQQLTISRELTRKLKNVESDSEEENIDSTELVNKNEDGDNPWVSGLKMSKDVTDFVSGYRKYWNENSNTSESFQDGQSENVKEEQKEKSSEENENEMEKMKEEMDLKFQNKKESSIKQKLTKNNKTQKSKKKSATSRPNQEYSSAVTESTTEWQTSILEDGGDVEDMFDKLEEKLHENLESRSSNVREPRKPKKPRIKKKQKANKIDLSLSVTAKKPIVDEQLIEGQEIHNKDNGIENNINQLKNILNSIVDDNIATSTPSSNIDPQKFMQVRPTKLKTAIPDISITDENEANESQRDIILEAFKDDDIAVEFRKEKNKEIEKDTPKDIDLNLPGWGSWGGTNIKPRKRKRFIIKMPPKMPRKDDNKGSLIINEKAQNKVKPHMVSELPFPFKTVKDYEASIRAPIGNTFVPETAFRKFIEPPLITKMGAIIEPINKTILMGEKKV